ncbi:MAG: hypothetical protein WBD27_14735 [Pyrinomonadaceae bacterium]
MTAQKKPDLTFYSTITADDFVMENVLCRAYLPLKVTDRVELHFHFDTKQTLVMRDADFWKFSIRRELLGYENKVEEVVTAEEIILSKFTVTSHAINFHEGSIIGKPQILTVTKFVNYPRHENRVNVAFWITPNLLLEHSLKVRQLIKEKKRLGDTEIELPARKETEFEPDSETKFIFSRHTRTYRNEEDDEIAFSEQIAKIEIEDAASDSPRILEKLQKLDDVLLLSSFASMKKTVCLGWEAFDGNTDVHHFLRDRYVPDARKSKDSLDNMVIDFDQFEEFMRVAYPNLIKYSQIDALRRAINFLVLRDKDTIDGGFMISYSALEMLVLHFRRRVGLELIFDQSTQWDKIRKSVKKHVEQLDLPIEDASKKGLMIEKISELNRISFATAFAQFCDHYKANLDDLWPVTTSERGISLSKLRNKLVHGEHFDDRHYGAIMYAKEHLRWTIGRMILGVLGWSADRSNISPERLRKQFAYKTWREDQKILSAKY